MMVVAMQSMVSGIQVPSLSLLAMSQSTSFPVFLDVFFKCLHSSVFLHAHKFNFLYLLTFPFSFYKISLVLLHIFSSLNHYLLICFNFCSSSVSFSLIILLPPWMSAPSNNFAIHSQCMNTIIPQGRHQNTLA